MTELRGLSYKAEIQAMLIDDKIPPKQVLKEMFEARVDVPQGESRGTQYALGKREIDTIHDFSSLRKAADDLVNGLNDGRAGQVERDSIANVLAKQLQDKGFGKDNPLAKPDYDYTDIDRDGDQEWFNKNQISNEFNNAAHHYYPTANAFLDNVKSVENGSRLYDFEIQEAQDLLDDKNLPDDLREQLQPIMDDIKDNPEKYDGSEPVVAKNDVEAPAVSSPATPSV